MTVPEFAARRASPGVRLGMERRFGHDVGGASGRAPTGQLVRVDLPARGDRRRAAADTIPRNLRGSVAGLWTFEGLNVLEVAPERGHKPRAATADAELGDVARERCERRVRRGLTRPA